MKPFAYGIKLNEAVLVPLNNETISLKYDFVFMADDDQLIEIESLHAFYLEPHKNADALKSDYASLVNAIRKLPHLELMNTDTKPLVEVSEYGNFPALNPLEAFEVQPESVDLLNDILQQYTEYYQSLDQSRKKFPTPATVIGGFYWLVRWSGLIKPVEAENRERQTAPFKLKQF